MGTTKLETLVDLCNAAVQTDVAEQAEIEAESEATTVKYAAMFAAQRLGDDVAAALGEWTAYDERYEGPSTWRAQVQIAPRAHLIYSVGEDGDDESLALHTGCDRCGHLRETPVHSVLGLASALQKAGLR